MQLFESDIPVNLLPYDGEVFYYGRMLEDTVSLFDELLKHIAWKNDEVIIFGKHIVTKRQSAWYGDHPYQYKYSGITRTAMPWTNALINLKVFVEQKTGEVYNSCLLNLYHSGGEGMAWHSDDEKELSPDAPIASLSLGAPRRFSFRHKATKETLSLTLEDGSLLLMKGTVQRHWLHSLPKTKRVTLPRINLTFRSIQNVSA
ncbi:MAG: alpha-ketoglutarate-dependent dioxygenase AlkB [Niabella sp.]